MNLIPTCAKHHMAFHNGDFKIKLAFEKEMKTEYAENWEDILFKMDRDHVPLKGVALREWLKDQELHYKSLTIKQ